MISVESDSVVTTPKRVVSRRQLAVVLLFGARLEREAFAALLTREDEFRPAAAPSIATAERMLGEMGNPPFAVLMDQMQATVATRRLLRRDEAQVAVVVRDPAMPALRTDRRPRFEVVTRDTPWRSIARLMLNRCGDIQSPRGKDDQQKLESLTKREWQVLELIAGGASVRECAESLGIAVSTVDNHKSRLMRKIGVKKSSELVRFAFRMGVTA